MTPPRRTRITVFETHRRPGWAALVYAVPANLYKEFLFCVFFGSYREQVEADAEQYRAALLSNGVLA